MKNYLLTLLIAGLCLPVLAQSDSVTVSGVVTDSSGDPAVEVLVGLLDELSGQETISFTDADGFYSMSLEVSADSPEGCLVLVMLDCDSYFFFDTLCYSPEETVLVVDLTYCAGGAESCDVFLFVTSESDSLVTLLAVSSGVGPYTYSWSEGSITQTIPIDVTITEEYCVTITDSQGCMAEDCINFGPPNPCFVNIFEEPFFNGTYLYAEGHGQSDSLAYQWSTGENGYQIFVEQSGDYCVTMTDALGCEAVDCRYIEVDTFGFDECFSYIYEESSNTDSMQTLTVVSFGAGPFTYSWSTGEITESIEITEEGTYCVTVMDSEGCETIACYDYLAWEECGVWVASDPTQEGVHVVAFAFGAEPIAYLWSTGADTQEILASESGEYCVSIIDGEGCTSDFCVEVEVGQVSDCFTLIEQQYLDNGTVALSIALPADGSYYIEWNTGEITDTIIADQTGTYCVEVLDIESGCSFSTCSFVWIDNVDPACIGVIDVAYLEESQAELYVQFVFSDLPIDPSAYLYAWSTGESTQTIAVDSDGDYCVTVTSIDASNCTFELCTSVHFEDDAFISSLFIAYYDIETEEGVDADIELYSVLPSGELELYTTVFEGNAFGIEGLYEIDSIVDGTYVALAIPEQDDLYIPSYHLETMFWDEADLFVFDSSLDNFQLIEIHAIPLTNLSGSGSIGGIATDDQLVGHAEGDVTRYQGPLSGANIMLTHQNTPVEQEYTDESGAYRFDNLPFGTFTVTLERPGHMRQQIEVTISANNPTVLDVLFETSLTSIDDVNMIAMTISPNPAADRLRIELPIQKQQKVDILISDMNGRTVLTKQAQLSPQQNSVDIDVRYMNRGMYNVSVSSEESRETRKFTKI